MMDPFFPKQRNSFEDLARSRFHLHDAFSLIEILATVAIVCFLAYFIFLVSGKVLESAKSGKDVMQMRDLGLAHARYVSDNNGKVMVGNDPATNETWFYHLIRPYLDLPLDNVTIAQPLISPLDPKKGRLPNRAPIHFRSYAINRRVLKSNLQVLRITELSHPGSMFWLVNFDVFKVDTNWLDTNNAKSVSALPSDWMRGGYVHLLFLDGHVETLKRDEILPGGTHDSVLGPKL